MAQKMKKDIMEMEEGEILKVAIKERGITQVELADRLGIRPSSLSGNINRRRMSLEVFGEILNALDYDVTVTDRETGEVKWKVFAK